MAAQKAEREVARCAARTLAQIAAEEAAQHAAHAVQAAEQQATARANKLARQSVRYQKRWGTRRRPGTRWEGWVAACAGVTRGPVAVTAGPKASQDVQTAWRRVWGTMAE